MRTPTITDLAATWRRRASTDQAALAGRAIIDLLANGRPVPPEALARATGTGVEQARAQVQSARGRGAEVTEDGAVAGLALTLRPTGHRFRVRGNDLFTWCGFDALFLPILLGEPAQVGSTCPVTGAGIRLRVQPDGRVSTANPATVVVGIVGGAVTSCCPVAGPGSAICTQMPLFASRAAAQRWLPDHPGVSILDLNQARRVARAYVEAGC